MEPEKKSLEKKSSSWKPSFSGSILNFGGVPGTKRKPSSSKHHFFRGKLAVKLRQCSGHPRNRCSFQAKEMHSKKQKAQMFLVTMVKHSQIPFKIIHSKIDLPSNSQTTLLILNFGCCSGWMFECGSFRRSGPGVSLCLWFRRVSW